MVKYAYTAYGTLKSISGSLATTIGQYNPFRFKGYYYDQESELFYCNGRYYSSELCRFIQPADISSLNLSSINGLNLYSYANNNPIGIAYRTNVGGATSGGMMSSVTLSGITNGNHLGGPNGSSESGFLGSLISSVSAMHGVVDSVSSYLAGTLVTKGSVALGSAVACSLVGVSIGGVTIGFGGAILIGGGVVALGIVAGTILIAVVSDALDNWWKKKKEEWFN